MSIVGKTMSATAALLLLCGCVQRDPFARPLADRLTDQVRSGGTFYLIGDTVDARRFANEVVQAIGGTVASTPMEEPFRRGLQKAISQTELGLRLAGFDEIAGYAASSTARPEGGFENRFFVAFPSEPRGALWKLFGSENSDWRDEIGELPGDTLAVISGEFHPEALVPLLREFGITGGELDARFTLMTGSTIESLLRNLSGEYGIVFGPGNVYDGGFPHVVAAFPDPEAKLFSRLQVMCRAVPGSVVEGQEIRFPASFAPDFQPVVISGDGVLSLFSSPAAVSWLGSSESRLADDEYFRRISAGMPDRALLVSYQRPGVEMPEVFGNLSVKGLTVDIRRFQSGFITLLVREPDGMLMISNCDIDFNCQFLFSAVTAAAMAVEFIDEHPSLLAGLTDSDDDEYDDDGDFDELNEPEAVEELSAHDREMLDRCTQSLEQIRDAVNDYADAHNGELPAADGAGGFKEFEYPGGELPGCPASGDGGKSLIYLGPWKAGANGRLPLVIDRPENHPDHFNVLYLDGSVRTHMLNRPGSFKRMAGFLHTVNDYSEADFRELIRRADAIDRASGAN